MIAKQQEEDTRHGISFADYVDKYTSREYDEGHYTELERQYFGDYLLYCESIGYKPVCGLDF